MRWRSLRNIEEPGKDNMSKTRSLKPNEENEILAWCHANPKANLDGKIAEWRVKYNCSEFSIMKLFVRERLIKINETKNQPKKGQQ
jgi:hypothetical protein